MTPDVLFSVEDLKLSKLTNFMNNNYFFGKLYCACLDTVTLGVLSSTKLY